MQIIVFRLNDEQFAVETSKVQGINDMMQITKVPGAPKYIKGLINLRGNVISLLDLELLLDIEKKGFEKNNIIILSIRDELVGIAVDAVSEVMDVTDNKLEKIKDNKNREYVKSIVNLGDRIVTLIDIDELKLN
ncbi:chemotaxis protein CheW [Clostridium thermarum]|uniref:chemotaxis protein CheW n=1 Tax=Clostridium thermarum TaxID=1716543 RepID=UPI0013D418E4|nr:chemotaxis protein CheW [Clostridium thermarum]